MRFDGRTTVAGYDPEKYLKQYEDHSGDINAMRRAQYAQNKDKINAQKRAAYALRQKNRGRKVSVTDIAIDKVPLVTLGGISEETARTVQQAHKELLRFAKEQNDSNEVAGMLDLTTGERLHFVKGDQTSVNIEADADTYHWLRTRPERSLLLLHNHPGQSYFSMNDVQTFLVHDKIRAVSIVTNQGKVWTISKTTQYNPKKAFDLIIKCSEQYKDNWDEVIDTFLRSGYNCGIERG